MLAVGTNQSAPNRTISLEIFDGKVATKKRCNIILLVRTECLEISVLRPKLLAIYHCNARLILPQQPTLE